MLSGIGGGALEVAGFELVYVTAPGDGVRVGLGFGPLCQLCPLRADCTRARRGRVISIHLQEALLQHAKTRQRDPAWQADNRTFRPVVERKISHFTRRPWGGRKARCRGQKRVLTDVLARAGAINLARLATLGLHHGTLAGRSPDPNPSQTPSVNFQMPSGVETPMPPTPSPPWGTTSAASLEVTLENRIVVGPSRHVQ